MTKNIATAYVRFIQTPDGKRRPIFILRETEQKLYFFNITTKYANKSDYMKQYYFEIKAYFSTGLKKHSWIDTYRMYSLDKEKVDINFIGKLSDHDTTRLRDFLTQQKSNLLQSPNHS